MSFFNPLLLLTILLPFITSKNTCPTSICKNSNFIVKFPFYKDDTQISCTYPGFKLGCTKQGLTSLNLLYSGEFLVRYINYQTQELKIYDSNSCLAKRLLHLDLLYSPFMSPYYVNSTFLTCPTKLVKSKYRVIDCLSDYENTTLATTSLDLATNMSSCEIIGTYMIPIARPGPYNDDIFSYVVDNDIILTWDEPNCMECEARGANCKFIDKSNQVVCYYDHETGKQNGLQMFKIVSLSIAIPGLACVLAFAFVVCSITRAAQQLPQEIAPQTDTIIDTGLDETTIESYTKVTLGESRRLPGPGDGTCAICLADFCAKDIIRIIPDCKHCFHATCIDEWLRMRSTCPVCRNSPLPSSAQENMEQG